MPVINLMRAFQTPPPPIDFVLPGLMKGTVGLLASPGGAGKSQTALQLALAVCSPLANLLGVSLEKHGGVLYVSLEDPREIIETRLFALGEHLSVAARDEVAARLMIEDARGTGLLLTDPEWQQTLVAMAAACEARLIIVDTLSRAHTCDENSNGEMARLLLDVERLAIASGAAVLLLHHTNKSAAFLGRADEQQAARGASALVDNARWLGFVASMTAAEAQQHGVDEARREYFVRFGVAKRNYGPPVEQLWLERREGGVLLPARFSRRGR